MNPSEQKSYYALESNWKNETKKRVKIFQSVERTALETGATKFFCMIQTEKYSKLENNPWFTAAFRSKDASSCKILCLDRKNDSIDVFSKKRVKNVYAAFENKRN